MSYVNRKKYRIYELRKPQKYLYFMSYVNHWIIKMTNLTLKTPDFVLRGNHLILVYINVILKC